MAAFETESFDFYYYDQGNYDHLHFLAKLAIDRGISKYATGMFDYLAADQCDDLDRAYLVGTKTGDLFGYLNLFYYDQTPINQAYSNLHYAISSKHRHTFARTDHRTETIGCKMLRESTNYLLTAHQQIKFIQIEIQEKNIRSIKAALHAGFKKLEGISYAKNMTTDYIPDIIMPDGFETEAKSIMRR